MFVDLTLTLPGSIPGLLRRGSPVVIVSTEGQTTDCDGDRLEVGYVGTLTDEPTERYCVASGLTVDDLGPGWSELPLSGVALDLTNATGRVHAAWWALDRCHRGGWPGLHVGARLWLDPVLYSDPSGLRRPRRGPWEALRSAGRIHDWLADLDPSDPRRLPDGSRYVDAEALRRVVVLLHRVALHVAGRTA